VDPKEPVAILFGDDIFDAKIPVTAQLIAAYEKYHDPVIALYDVGRKNVSSYGIASGKMLGKDLMEIDGFVEKPRTEDAPSSLAAVGRYIITPEIMELLKSQKPGKDGEIRLADAFISHLKRDAAMYGRIAEAVRYDCGNKAQFLLANIAYGLRHPQVAPDFKKGLKKLLLNTRV
jgi:UTP--glucose-1-phosphate uridylyltransferase